MTAFEVQARSNSVERLLVTAMMSALVVVSILTIGIKVCNALQPLRAALGH